MNEREMAQSPGLGSTGFLSKMGPVVAITSGPAGGQKLAQTKTSAKTVSPLTPLQRYVMVAGRVLVAIIFMMTALNIISQTFAEHELAAHGVSSSLIPVLILAARALQLFAGLGLILGIYPRLSALGLLLFLIPATLMAHEFWLAAGTSLYTVQLINFFKNVCMAGGLLFIIATKNQPVVLPRPTDAD